MPSASRPSLDDEIDKFRSRMEFRNLREWASCAVVAMAFGSMACQGTGILHRLSAAEIVAAAGYIGFRLYRDGRVCIPGRGAGIVTRREAYFRELLRQAALLGGVARWYVGPLAVGWFGLELAGLLDKGPRGFSFVYLVSGILFGIFLVWLNRRAARKLRDRAAELALEITG